MLGEGAPQGVRSSVVDIRIFYDPDHAGADILISGYYSNIIRIIRATQVQISRSFLRTENRRNCSIYLYSSRKRDKLNKNAKFVVTGFQGGHGGFDARL